MMSFSGPCSALPLAICRRNVRSCVGRYRSGCRSHSRANNVVDCRAGSRSSCSTTQGQSSSNGFERVCHSWGRFKAEGNAPACSYLRAVRSLMPARAAACFCVIPFLRSDIDNLTSQSFFIGHHLSCFLMVPGFAIFARLSRGMALFVSAVVSIKRHPARVSQVALPHLHANSTGLPGFVRILGISPRLPSLAPHHLSRSKCQGVLPPPQLKAAISHKQTSRLTGSSLGRQG